MKDLDEGLIAGRGRKETAKQRQKVEECLLKIRTLRNKNNELQKHMDDDLERDMRKAVRSQAQFVENEVTELRKMLNDLANYYTDPGFKAKLKDICQQAGKQIQRNKKIMEQFVNNASSASFAHNSTSFVNRPSKSVADQGFLLQKHSVIDTEQMKDEIAFQQQLTAERQAALRDIEYANNKINKMMIDMAEVVEEQGEQVDLIDVKVREAKQNIEGANEELDDAQSYQKKSKKKYICIIVLILAVLAGGGVLIYFFLS